MVVRVADLTFLQKRFNPVFETEFRKMQELLKPKPQDPILDKIDLTGLTDRDKQNLDIANWFYCITCNKWRIKGSEILKFKYINYPYVYEYCFNCPNIPAHMISEIDGLKVLRI